MVLFGRNTPLCEHHIADFGTRTDRYARAFARTHPTEQSQPKTHVLCAEMPDQAERMGGPGMLGEPVIEGTHVRDNEMKRRFGPITDPLENLRLRAESIETRASKISLRRMSARMPSPAQKCRVRVGSGRIMRVLS